MSDFTPAPKEFRVWDGKRMWTDDDEDCELVLYMDGSFSFSVLELPPFAARLDPLRWVSRPKENLRLLQFTGLTDVDGAKVFEGHIVAFTQYAVLVNSGTFSPEDGDDTEFDDVDCLAVVVYRRGRWELDVRTRLDGYPNPGGGLCGYALHEVVPSTPRAPYGFQGSSGRHKTSAPRVIGHVLTDPHLLP